MLNQFVNILLLSTIHVSLFAATNYEISLLEYKENGLSKLENTLDVELTKKEYWYNYLQDKDTKFGYIEQYSSVLACDKKRSTLTLYIKNSDEKYEFIRAHSAFTGEKEGAKIHEGDKKTPVGIYKIVEKLSEKTQLDPYYGPFAFVTSYPNLYDKYQGKNGHGIWIHGLPSEKTRNAFTRGCIAIKNSNIECLEDKISIENTLLIINEDKVKTDISKDTLSLLLSSLYKWRYSWLHNNINTYLDFYSTDFIRNDGMKYKSFVRYKTRVFKKIEKKTIIFKNITIVPYPNTQNTYLITFEEYYKSDSFQFTGDKTLIVKLTSDKRIKIFTEK